MTVTSTLLPPPVEQKFLGKLLSTPEARLIHTLGATHYPMPQHSGDILRKRRYRRLETVPVAVDPAMMNPPSQQGLADDIDVHIRWYATYEIVSEQVTLINEDPVLNAKTARLSQCLAETEDQLIRDMLEATAALVNCTGGVNGDNPTEITRADVDGVAQTLQGNDAEFVAKLMEGANKFGTAPLRDAYLVLCHTDMIGQLENVAGFTAKAEYPNPNGALNAAEWGSIGNCRFFTSSRGSITANASLAGADVYNMFTVAQEAYSTTELDGGTVSLFYHEAGRGDDPCHLRQTLGFRMTLGTNIDNDAWLINLRATLG